MKPGSISWRRAVWGVACKRSDIVRLNWCGTRIWINIRAVEAFRAMEAIITEFEYEVRPVDTGAYNCRNIKGTNTPSSHSWGTAVDINWNTNPWLTKLVTDMPRGMIDTITAIRTANRKQVWRWGGDWDGRPDTPHTKYDSMHFEIICGPEDLATGVVLPEIELPVLREGATGRHVATVQRLLGVAGPARYGPKTKAAVERFQRWRNLTDDGVVGLKTWAELRKLGT